MATISITATGPTATTFPGPRGFIATDGEQAFAQTWAKHAHLYLAFQEKHQETLGEPNALLPDAERLVVRAMFEIFNSLATEDTGLTIARNIAAIYYQQGNFIGDGPGDSDYIDGNPPTESIADRIHATAIDKALTKVNRRNTLRDLVAKATQVVLAYALKGNDPGALDGPKNGVLREQIGLPLEIFNKIWGDNVQPILNILNGSTSITPATIKTNLDKLIEQHKVVFAPIFAAGGRGRRGKSRRSKSPGRRSPGRKSPSRKSPRRKSPKHRVSPKRRR
jgi:hypothetical protein